MESNVSFQSFTTNNSKSPQPSNNNDVQGTTSSESVVERETWQSHIDFILSSLGFAVGLGNVWRFPYLAFKNGGAAFMIPYLISVVLAGLPLYGLESFLGQLSGLGASEAHGCLAPIFQGIGWTMVGMSYIVTLYYNMIIAWSIFYLFDSFREVLPYSTCKHEWNSYDCYSYFDDKVCSEIVEGSKWFNRSCVNSTEDIAKFSDVKRTSSTDEYFYRYVLNYDENVINLGSISWRLALCLFAAWTIVFLCIAGGIKFSGKVVYFTALFPYVILIILLVFGAFLPGAGDGIYYYLVPDASRLCSFEVWKDAAVQVFFSLNPAMGGIITMASYNKFHTNLEKDAIVICILDSLTSLLAGCSIFTSVGFLAHELNTTVAEATKNSIGLAFIAFPETIAHMPGSHFWSVGFFIMLMTLGLNSQFIMYETGVSAITDTFPKFRHGYHRLLVVAVGCFTSFLIGLIFCTQNGIYAFLLFDDHSAGFCTLIVAFMESVLIAYIYGIDNFINDIFLILGKKLNWYWRIVWLITCPFYMLMLFVYFLYFHMPSEFRDTPMSSTAQSLGWCISLTAVLIMISVGIYHIVQNRRNKQRWIALVLPTKRWNPRKRQEKALTKKGIKKSIA